MTRDLSGDRLGPMLHFRGHDDQGSHLAAVLICPAGDIPGPLTVADKDVAPQKLSELPDHVAWRYDFILAAHDTGYTLEGKHHPVASDMRGDMRMGFVSCNGEESGDLGRDDAERNAMWARLADRHRAAPLSILLQGGDQIYADEATHGHPLSEDWPLSVPDAPDETALADLRDHLRRRFAERYILALGSAPCVTLMAQVPTLAIWDDHDICDGWGSLPDDRIGSAVGQTLFQVAREMCLIFQMGAVEADLPDLCLTPDGISLGWMRKLPGVTLVAPDLRSERTMQQVMGDAGWAGVAAATPDPGHVFVVSSVPLLGPRLSLIEGFVRWLPGIQKYEDDLRDQWQSHAHRDEWRRMLRETLRFHGSGPVTVLSGEIHLATRGEMAVGDGKIHQLVASGIAHRAPPKGFARGLGLLAGLGAAPFPDHPIRILPLPGHSQTYVGERNFLILERCADTWTAVWHLEDSGPTPPMDLSS